MDQAKAEQTARVLALAAPLALLGGAYLSQYGFGLYPCEMCWWQRWAHFAALALAALAYVARPGRFFAGLAALAMGVSGAIGLFHAGVEYGWWEGLTACSTIAPLGSGDALDAIMNSPLVRCDVAPWSLWGISLAGWNFALSGAAALTVFQLLRRAGAAA